MKRSGRSTIGVAIAVIAVLGFAWWQFGPRYPHAWSDADLRMLASLSIDSLPPLPADPSNAVADNEDAARLGQRLFFDPRLSGNGQVSCATCHVPDKRFTDGLPKGRGIGLSGRNTRSIVGTAYSPWLYWDGRRDSQWSQGLSPLEDPAEHGGNRVAYVRFISMDESYREQYESLFGPLPDFADPVRFPSKASPLADTEARLAWAAMAESDQRLVNSVFANIGKAIAAYERRILHGPSRFDDYVRAITNGDPAAADILTTAEILGLQLFIDEARCIECHNGPLFTNNEFHNTGMLSFPGDLPDRGRIDGVRKVQNDPFNCLGDYSDDPDRNCPELTYVRTGSELVGATRTPSLRDLAGTAPYGHKGQQESLADVLKQYNDSPPAMIGHNEAENPLGLSRRELGWLEAF
ncbi:MAG: cytochrome-c peroxidase, partial [Gammaproteobacteria bacterium]|nr:cytochrome-c peroxidase [Gammaproteobacteria bacterium]